MKVHYNSKPISSAVTTSVTTIFFTSKWHSPGHPRKQERQPGYPVTWDFSVSDEEGRCTGRLEFLFLPNLFLNKEERQVERLGAAAQRAEDGQQRNPSWENRRLGSPSCSTSLDCLLHCSCEVWALPLRERSTQHPHSTLHRRKHPG